MSGHFLEGPGARKWAIWHQSVGDGIIKWVTSSCWHFLEGEAMRWRSVNFNQGSFSDRLKNKYPPGEASLGLTRPIQGAISMREFVAENNKWNRGPFDGTARARRGHHQDAVELPDNNGPGRDSAVAVPLACVSIPVECTDYAGRMTSSWQSALQEG